MFCQQHNADAFNECDSSGLISCWTLCIKAESHSWIRGSAQLKPSNAFHKSCVRQKCFL